MALSARQVALYVHTVNVFKPQQPTLGTDNAGGDTLVYPATPTYSGVKCYRRSMSEVTEAELSGRFLENNMLTMDVFDFEASVDVSSEYVLHFVTPGHPDQGMYFLVIGQPTIKNLLANKMSVLTKRSLRPQGVPPEEDLQP